MNDKEKLIDRFCGILAKRIHDDYAAGPNGHLVYKSDVYKHMAKAAAEAVKKPSAAPKGFKF